MTEIRCVKCKRLLMKTNGDGEDGLIFEVKCPKCGYIGSYSLGKFTTEQLTSDDNILAEVNKGITILSVK